MKIILSAVILLVVLAGGSANGETAGDVVGLDKYLDLVRARHPFFAKEQMASDIQRKQSERYLGREDWRLVANGSLTHTEPLETSPFVPRRIDVFGVGAGAERVFWGNGSRLSVGWIHDVTDQDLEGFSIPIGAGGSIDVPIGPATYYRNVLNATYSLPLLKNRGGELDRLEYELSLFDVDVSKTTALENQEDFLLDVGVKFLQWVLAEEQLRIGQERFDLAEEELKRTKRKREAFLVEEVDVLRAVDAVHNTKSTLLLIESQWKALQAELATLARDESIFNARPKYDIYTFPGQGSVEPFVERVFEQSRLVGALETRLAQMEMMERGVTEAQKSELALNLSASLLGGDKDFGGALETTNPDIGVFVEFRHFLGNRSSVADAEKTRLQIRQLETSIQDVRVTLEAGVRGIMVRMEKLGEVIDGNVEQIESNRRRTEEEIELYNRGRGDLTYVIQSRDRVAVSMLTYAENAAQYHNLLLQLYALADELLLSSVKESE